MADSRRLELELDCVATAAGEKMSELDVLREQVRAAKLSEVTDLERHGRMEEKLRRQLAENARRYEDRNAGFAQASPFLFEHIRSLRGLCRKPPDRRRWYDGHCPCDSSIHWRHFCLLWSTVGENQWDSDYGSTWCKSLDSPRGVQFRGGDRM